jgi:uncharacterized protein (TIGR02246 family)
MTDMLTAEDRLDIKQVLVLWAQYEDQGKADAWAGLFTPDGSCTYSDGRVIVGRAALAQASAERWDKPKSKRCIHWMGDAAITGTRTQADVTNYCIVFEKTEAGMVSKGASLRSYVFVRSEGQWLISIRTYQPMPYAEWNRTQA